MTEMLSCKLTMRQLAHKGWEASMMREASGEGSSLREVDASIMDSDDVGRVLNGMKAKPVRTDDESESMRR